MAAQKGTAASYNFYPLATLMANGIANFEKVMGPSYKYLVFSLSNSKYRFVMLREAVVSKKASSDQSFLTQDFC